MSFEPPAGILDIGNATLRVGKLEVAETSGLNQGLLNIVKNNLLITSNTEYASSNTWGIKLPTTWVADFDVKGHSEKYVEFNFYNEDKTSNALGYLLNFKDTTLSLMYDTSLSEDQNILATATIPTIVGAFRKVNIFFERGVISVSIDGTRYLYFKESDGFNQGLGVASRVVSTTGSAFVNLFIEQNAGDSAFKNLRIVNGRFISDKTSNIAFIGGNLGVGVNSPKEALDIRGNMHLTRVSNVSQIKVESNVVAEYTGPHDRPLRKYPEVAMTANDNSSTSGYTASASSSLTAGQPYINFDGNLASHWHSRYPYYNTSTGAYSPGSAGDGQSPSGTLATNELVSGHQGEWVSIELPKKIKLEKLKVIGSTRLASGTTQFPKDVVVAVSETGLTGSWSALETATLISQNVSNHSDTINITTQTSYYKYFALIVKSINSTSTYSAVEIAELEFYGHEEGSGSLDTTLKTVYNVPATTGTQLEVYYDAKDLADGNAPTNPVDLSPNTNNATLGGDPQVSNGAFVFDGSGDAVISGATSFSGSPTLSYSVWFKTNSILSGTGSNSIVMIGHAASTKSLGFRIKGTGDTNPGNYRFYVFGGATNESVETGIAAVLGRWTHATIVRDGLNMKLYIDGKFADENTNTTTTLNLDSSAKVALGNYIDSSGTVTTISANDSYDGSIANFRLYSKALNADQVKELYDYQKDYFLGSKSQVTLYKGHLGIGVTEPSGQLELAGDERIQEYPPGPMGPSPKYETLIPGHGVFCWNTVNYYPGSPVQNFNGSGMYAKDGATTGWYGPYQGHNGYTGGNVYAGTDFAATSSSGLGFNDAYGNRYYGAWTTFKLPYKINLKKIHIDQWATSDGANARCAPEDGVILGSNNGVDWYHVHTFTGLQYGGSAGNPSYSAAGEDVTINCNTDYSQYALVITRTLHYVFTAMIGELKWFGTPGPTTLDKGSLTLGRSLDVPRISRYDVDAETPRPEKLVVDFDTTLNSTPIDISGQGNPAKDANHGFLDGATYSAADKAFVFDGSNDEILVSSIPGATDNYVHSVSTWVKFTNTPAIDQIFMLGTDNNNNLTSAVRVDGTGAFKWFFYNNDVAYTTYKTLSNNTWYHLVCSYTGGSNVSDRKFWLDGIELTGTSTGSSFGSPLDLPTNAALRIGHRHNNSNDLTGQISNFKLYSVALEASEAKKLYRLGRTGRSMVISDTTVGIGKVPEAHLDVRGLIKGMNATTSIAAWSVSRSADITNVSVSTAIYWDDVQYNIGGCYSNPRFTAPISGYYYHSFHIITRSDAQATYMGYFINDVDVDNSADFGSYDQGGSGHRNMAGSWIQYLNAGDYIYMVLKDGSMNGNLNRWSGFFLST